MQPAAVDVRKGLLLALLATSQFVVVLDASITNVALPSIGRDLGLSQDSLSWVVNAYTLTFGGFLLLGGRLADILGRRRVYMAGLVLFGVASFVGGFSQTEGMLIVARAVQGLGAALLSPAALSILTTVFREGAERNRALGVWGAVAGAGGAAGVLLGGILTEYLSWRWVLFVNVPIAAGAVLLAPRLVPGEPRRAAAQRLRRRRRVHGHRRPRRPDLRPRRCQQRRLGLGADDRAARAGRRAARRPSSRSSRGRARRSCRSTSSAHRTRTGAYATGLLVGASLFSMFFFISLYMQQVLGWDALKSGLAYLPLAITIIISAGVASVLVTKIGFKPVVIAGLLFIAAGLLLFSRISAGGSFTGDVLFPSLLAALGLGFSFVPVTIGGTTGISQDEAGLASGLINAGQQVGGALGLAILAALATARTDAVATGLGAPSRTALTEGFSAAFLGGAAFALIGAVVAMFLIRSEDSRALIGQTPEPAA